MLQQKLAALRNIERQANNAQRDADTLATSLASERRKTEETLTQIDALNAEIAALKAQPNEQLKTLRRKLAQSRNEVAFLKAQPSINASEEGKSLASQIAALKGELEEANSKLSASLADTEILKGKLRDSDSIMARYVDYVEKNYVKKGIDPKVWLGRAQLRDGGVVISVPQETAMAAKDDVRRQCKERGQQCSEPVAMRDGCYAIAAPIRAGAWSNLIGVGISSSQDAAQHAALINCTRATKTLQACTLKLTRCAPESLKQ